ncbi:serine/threonine-protein kinase [Roseimicrobium gellanilyticum]|nr:serine/threonine-protein kinase [Roseimicrobium gellanilyticum]
MHDSRFESPPDLDEDEDIPPPQQGKGPAKSLEDDELAAELPNFELVERLGKGGMGVVWKARERVLNRHVAIKLLHNVKNDAAFVERFTREACVMAQLNHPNIVTLYSFGRTRSNHCYLVMEMVDGADLADLMSHHRLDVPTALTIVHDICGALGHAHEAGFVHRDIKPGNVLIDMHGRVKVADFGLARLTRLENKDTLAITKQGWAVGTPHYTAPEQANGRGDEDHRADIYSLGVMLYQMLTGELPIGIFRPPSLKEKIDRRLDKVVLRALQEEPEKRYQDIEEFSAEVQTIREDVDPVLLEERKEARYATRWKQRLEMALAISLSLVLGTMGAWFVRDWMESPGQKKADTTGAPLPDGGVTTMRFTPENGSTGPAITREVRIQPPSLSKGSLFGRSVSVKEDWLAVGAPNDVSQSGRDYGAVYLYKRDEQGEWSLKQCLPNPHPGLGCRFGHEVALCSGRLVVASPRHPKASKGMGTVDMYEYHVPSGRWRPAGNEIPLLESPALGVEVLACKGRYLAMESQGGFHADSPATKVHLYSPAPGALTAGHTEITGLSDLSASTDAALINEREFITSQMPSEHNSGSPTLLHVMQKDGAWQSQPLMGPMPESGAPPPGNFQSVAATDSLVVAGSPKWNHLTGLVWVLRRDATGGFTHEAYIRPEASQGSGEFGKSVAATGQWLAVGADHCVVADAHRGAVSIFKKGEGAGSGWDRHFYIPAASRSGAAAFGYSLALTPQWVAVGAPNSGMAESMDPADMDTATGAVFVYEFSQPLP